MFSIIRRELFRVAIVCALLPTDASAQSAAVARLIVGPVALRLEVGARRDVVVEAYSESGSVIPLERAGVTFTSTDVEVVTVNTQGTATALKNGRAEIVVSAGGQSRRLTVTVGAPSAPVVVQGSGVEADSPASPPPPPALDPTRAIVSGVIEPGVIQLLPTERFKPSFRLRYADGTSAEAADVAWSPFGTSIGFDAAKGEVIGVIPGAAVLGGTYAKTITHSIPVAVAEVQLTADRDTLLLVAGAMDTVRMLVPAQSRRVVTQNLSWRTTDPSVLRVFSPSSGVVQARDGGSADLIVDGYGITRRIPVRVTPRIARIEAAVPPGTTVSLGVGAATALDARAIGSAGTRLTSVALIWRSQDSTVARVDAQGTIIAMSTGTTTVTLDSPGLEQARWPVTVVASSVQLGLKPFAMFTGALRNLTAELRGTAGQSFGSAASPRWTSSNTTVATVDGNGTVNAQKPGRTMIRVEQPGAGVDSVPVFVTGRALISGFIGGSSGIWQLLGVNDTVPQVLVAGDTVSLSQAAWSPDRTRLVATVELRDKAQTSRVVVMDADGRNWRTISPDNAMSNDPAWTTDGTAVLMAVRDAKTSSIIRVPVAGGVPTPIVSVTDGRVRAPMPGSDSGAVIVRMEKGAAMDLARVRDGTMQLLTTSKPREELVTVLRDGRLLVATDSTGRGRPASLALLTLAGDAILSSVRIVLPPGLIITDVSRGVDDETAYVVGRLRSRAGSSGPVLVILRVSLQSGATQTVLVLTEKDSITVRSD